MRNVVRDTTLILGLPMGYLKGRKHASGQDAKAEPLTQLTGFEEEDSEVCAVRLSFSRAIFLYFVSLPHLFVHMTS